ASLPMEFADVINALPATEPTHANKRTVEITSESAPRPSKPAEMSGDRSVLLSISHVSAAYGEFQALFDVSLDIREREIVALIGLNGAGKTTLIRALTRQLPLTQGDVVFRGKSIAHERPYYISELGIAQCIEGRKIFPELTVLENLEIGAYCKRA